MQPLLIVYATREGYTRTVAEHAATRLRERGIAIELDNAEYLSAGFDLTHCYRAVLVAASVHGGRHEAEIVEFVKRHRSALEHVPTAFLSINLFQAAAHDTLRSQAQRERAAARVAAAFKHFRDHTGWTPQATLSVAGALRYSNYSRPLRWITRLIARSLGLTTDTAHDHVFTDWPELDAFLDRFADTLWALQPEVENGAAPRGRPDGNGLEDWCGAKADLEAEHARTNRTRN